jgi:AraC-like DNA-binding protein
MKFSIESLTKNPAQLAAEDLRWFRERYPSVYGDQMYPAFDLRLAVDYVEQQLGEDKASEILEAVEMSRTDLADRQFVLAWQVLRAMELAATWLPPPAAGARFGSIFHPNELDGLKVLFADCKTLGDVYQVKKTNPNLVGNFTDNQAYVDGELLVERIHNVSGIEADVFRFIFEQSVSSKLAIARILTGDRLDEVEVRFAEPSPGAESEAVYRELFGCAVIFDCKFYEWAFALTVLELPLIEIPQVNREKWKISDELSKDSIINRILTILLACEGEVPSLQEVAAILNTSERSLRRRLSELDTSYQRIINQVRCQLAIRMIQRGTFSADEIAELLGFSEVASFRSAFKKWTGRPPGTFQVG